MFGGADNTDSKSDKPENPLAKQAESFLNELWPKIRSAYLIYHQSIWESYLFKVGQMWIDWDQQLKLWQPAQPADDFVPQPRLNRFAPAIDAITSNFAQIPEIESIPKESLGDTDDMKRYGISEVATLLGEHFLESNGLHGDFNQNESKVGNAGQMFVMNGCFFTYVYPHKKGTRQVQKTQQVSVPKLHCPNCDFYGPVPDPSQQQPAMPPAVPHAPATAGMQSVGMPPEQQPPMVAMPPQPGAPDSGQMPPQAPPGPACPECGASGQVQNSVDMQPVLGDDGEPQYDSIADYEMRCRLVNSLYAYPRPGSTGMDNTPYFLWPERFTLDEIKELWNYDATADNENPDSFNVVLEHALNFYYLGFQGGYAKSEDAALVIQMFVPTGKMGKFDKGVYAVYINGKVIHAEPWQFSEHPLTKANYQEVPTLFFPRSVAFDLVPVQRELRDYDSLIKLHGMTSAVEPIVAEENSLVSEITGRGDKVVLWRALGPNVREPHRMQHGALDEKIYAVVDRLERQMENISAAAQVFKGQQPGSVTAASAIQELRSQAEQMFAQPVSNWNACWKETTRKAVKFMQKWYSPQQIASIVGNDRTSQINDFLMCELDKEIEFVSTAHGLPRTRDEKRQEIMALWDRGALDINDVSVRQKAYELFGETGMLQSFNADATRARKENKDIKKGGQPNFMPEIEDLQVHLGEHGKQIKSLDFDTWAKQTQQVLIQHYIETKQAMAMQNAPPPSPKQPHAPPPGGPPGMPPIPSTPSGPQMGAGAA